MTEVQGIRRGLMTVGTWWWSPEEAQPWAIKPQEMSSAKDGYCYFSLKMNKISQVNFSFLNEVMQFLRS